MSNFIVKRFVKDAHYHLFNRGNNRADIFFDKSDYWAFRRVVRRSIGKVGNIEVIAFALLPNHYHFLVRQTDPHAVTEFMRSAIASYTKYVNKKYNRSGRLFGSVYNGRLLSEREIEGVRKYILTNPIEAGLIVWPHVGSDI